MKKKCFFKYYQLIITKEHFFRQIMKLTNIYINFIKSYMHYLMINQMIFQHLAVKIFPWTLVTFINIYHIHKNMYIFFFRWFSKHVKIMKKSYSFFYKKFKKWTGLLLIILSYMPYGKSLLIYLQMIYRLKFYIHELKILKI